MIRAVAVEDFPIIRDAICGALRLDDRIDLIGAYGCARSALDALAIDPPDAVLLDLHLPDMAGDVIIDRIRRVCVGTRILVFSACERPGEVRRALAAGAHGYVVKRQSAQQVIEALVAVCAGGTVIAPQVAGALLTAAVAPASSGSSSGDPAALNTGDLAILEHIVAGSTDDEIARSLYVSTRTVQNHLSRIRRIAGVQRRSQLVRWAIDNDVV